MSNRDFNQMLLVNADFLKPFAVTLTHDSEKAKDLFQETLFRALMNRDKYNVGTNIKAWLYTIMRNIFINDYRRNSKYQVVLDSTPNDFLLNTNQHIITGTAENRMSEKEIWSMVHQLPDIFRSPFIMYFNGYKYHDIATTLNEPLGTIKSRIHFARKLLKQYINKANLQGLNA
jgi:RNA polymerase sigma factor (sigma-70 family)